MHCKMDGELSGNTISCDNGNPEDKSSMGDRKAGYTMPGILHFIQHEWSRFEMERAQWEVEKAELKAKISFLQGERRGQENLKRDLVRRIKMLEFALKKERSNFHQNNLDNGTKEDGMRTPLGLKLPADVGLPQTRPHMPWTQGRQLLRQYLQEVGYSDTILDVRSQRVRSMFGKSHETFSPSTDGRSKVDSSSDGHDDQPETRKENLEAEVISNFDFLSGQLNDPDDEMADDNSDGVHSSSEVDENDRLLLNDDLDTDSALAEFDFLSVTDAGDSADSDMVGWHIDRNKLNAKKEKFIEQKRHSKRKGLSRPVKKDLQSMLETLHGSPDGIPPYRLNVSDANKADEDPSIFGAGSVLGDESDAIRLGELAGLTVANEADPLSYDISSTKDTFRKTWTPKFTLRSHFDGVRGVVFLPAEPAVITASEDNTLKLWNLSKTLPSKKPQALDVEPVYSFRGHVGAVLSVTLNTDGTSCFSGGVDSSIRMWAIPNIQVDTCDPYVSSMTDKVLVGHTDSVWSLSYSGTRNHLLSASADTTVRLWDPQSSDPLIKTFAASGHSTPSSATFLSSDSGRAAVSHTDGKVLIYDLETGQVPISLAEADGCRINSIISHPTMPITMSAHDDRYIRFYDNVSGKPIHSMVAHLDSVTCLSVDPNGLYLLSGSHDCSIRLWNLDSKTCVQEITCHRKKFDESINAVAFHQSASYIASGGSDALAKVFI